MAKLKSKWFNIRSCKADNGIALIFSPKSKIHMITLYFILKLKKISVVDISNDADVSRQKAYAVLSGDLKSQKIKNAFVDALGFNPWAS